MYKSTWCAFVRRPCRDMAGRDMAGLRDVASEGAGRASRASTVEEICRVCHEQRRYVRFIWCPEYIGCETDAVEHARIHDSSQ